MAEPFLGEIRTFSFNFAPSGWAVCHGQLVPISQNIALFSLLGTRYGGNGTTTFGLPNLQGRAAVHRIDPATEGQTAGSRVHTLGINEIPAHGHDIFGSSAEGNSASPHGNLPAVVPAAAGALPYAGRGPLAPMHGDVIGAAGGGQPHNNMQPFLTINFCIALQGIYPSTA